jgi:hypothetical protein
MKNPALLAQSFAASISTASGKIKKVFRYAHFQNPASLLCGILKAWQSYQH